MRHAPLYELAKASFANVWPARIKLSGTNTEAYFSAASMTKKKNVL
jgi:hypothetical protein